MSPWPVRARGAPPLIRWCWQPPATIMDFYLGLFGSLWKNHYTVEFEAFKGRKKYKSLQRREELHTHTWRPHPPSHLVRRRRVWDEEVWDGDFMAETFGVWTSWGGCPLGSVEK